MKSKICWAVLGALIAVLILSMVTFLTSYEKNVDQMLATLVKYKGESMFTHLSSDACGYLTHGNRSLYFGELPSKECAIEINSPDRATLYVYPLDNDSIIVRYEPRNGIKRTYLKSGFGDFNRILEVFYELTGNEAFNESVEYQ